MSDSSEDDGDYVPTLKDYKKAGVAPVSSADQDEPELTGVAALREKKRLKEVDDLFDLMNQEDMAYKPKRQKVEAEP